MNLSFNLHVGLDWQDRDNELPVSYAESFESSSSTTINLRECSLWWSFNGCNDLEQQALLADSKSIVATIMINSLKQVIAKNSRNICYDDMYLFVFFFSIRYSLTNGFIGSILNVLIFTVKMLMCQMAKLLYIYTNREFCMLFKCHYILTTSHHHYHHQYHNHRSIDWWPTHAQSFVHPFLNYKKKYEKEKNLN